MSISEGVVQRVVEVRIPEADFESALCAGLQGALATQGGVELEFTTEPEVSSNHDEAPPPHKVKQLRVHIYYRLFDRENVLRAALDHAEVQGLVSSMARKSVGTVRLDRSAECLVARYIEDVVGG